MYENFVACIPALTHDDFVQDENLNGLVYEMVLICCCIEKIFVEFVEKFLMVMINQFRENSLTSLSVQKMAHRKQIQVSIGQGTKNFASILKDPSPGKWSSNNLLKGLIVIDKNYLDVI